MFFPPNKLSPESETCSTGQEQCHGRLQAESTTPAVYCSFIQFSAVLFQIMTPRSTKPILAAFPCNQSPKNTRLLITGKFDKERKFNRCKSAHPGSSTVQWELAWPLLIIHVLLFSCTATLVSVALVTRKWPFHLLPLYVYSVVSKRSPCVFCGVLDSFNFVCATKFIKLQQPSTNTCNIFYCNNTFYAVWSWMLACGPAGPAPRWPDTAPPHVNLCVLLPLITGEVQPELQVQGAYRGKRLQHLCLPPLEAQRQADVCLAERTGEATARSQGPAEAPVHPLSAHAAVVAAWPRTLSSIRLALPTMLM